MNERLSIIFYILMGIFFVVPILEIISMLSVKHLTPEDDIPSRFCILTMSDHKDRKINNCYPFNILSSITHNETSRYQQLPIGKGKLYRKYNRNENIIKYSVKQMGDGFQEIQVIETAHDGDWTNLYIYTVESGKVYPKYYRIIGYFGWGLPIFCISFFFVTPSFIFIFKFIYKKLFCLKKTDWFFRGCLVGIGIGLCIMAISRLGFHVGQWEYGINTLNLNSLGSWPIFIYAAVLLFPPSLRLKGSLLYLSIFIISLSFVIMQYLYIVSSSLALWEIFRLRAALLEQENVW